MPARGRWQLTFTKCISWTWFRLPGGFQEQFFGTWVTARSNGALFVQRDAFKLCYLNLTSRVLMCIPGRHWCCETFEMHI